MLVYVLAQQQSLARELLELAWPALQEWGLCFGGRLGHGRRNPILLDPGTG